MRLNCYTLQFRPTSYQNILSYPCITCVLDGKHYMSLVSARELFLHDYLSLVCTEHIVLVMVIDTVTPLTEWWWWLRNHFYMFKILSITNESSEFGFNVMCHNSVRSIILINVSQSYITKLWEKIKNKKVLGCQTFLNKWRVGNFKYFGCLCTRVIMSRSLNV